MRWDTLRIEAEDQAEQAKLPGYRDDAVIRRFDAPEALDIRFYEVRAKTALNRVPEQSQVPFRWTINPYRGCTHACVYCVHPDTPVLLADGRQRAIGALEVGDRIVGTERRGTYRHFVETEVKAQWSTRKPAYRIVLEDGTELVASGDHRFLTRRGWKFVTGAQRGAARRPHLTLNDELLGFGALPAAPVEDEAYRRGYLCGMVRGDANLATYRYERIGRAHGDVHRFRLALADGEALTRAQTYLASFGVSTQEFLFSAATDVRREVRAIRTSAASSVETIRELIRWPGSDAQDAWCKGFVAGIFDAEGHRGGCLRIANSDEEILGWTVAALRTLGFRSTVEPARPDTGVCNVRVLGGQVAQQRLLHLTGSAISRKRGVVGQALKTSAELGVVSIEPLGSAIPLVDITTGTGDFIANGVVSHNCFARPTHKYLDLNAGRDFEREIVVKVNVPEVLAAELRRPSWKREHVAMGTNTDPYQWVEGRYKLMRGIWPALREGRTPCSVLTKSPLVLRDLDLLLQVQEVVDVSANLSIPTIEEKAWRASEPHTPNPRARMEAVAELNRAGIPCGILVAPLMPGINDDPRQVEEILKLAGEAGATGISGIPLHLRGDVRGIFLDWLRSYRPDLVERYEELYARGAYMGPQDRERVAAVLQRAGGPPPRAFRRQVRDDPQRLAQRRERVLQEALF